MRRVWIKQRFPWTCAMVATVNAAIWWHLHNVPSQASREWQRLIIRCGAQYGPATKLEPLYRKLAVAPVRIIPNEWAIRLALDKGIPVRVEAQFKGLGFHAVLVLPGGKKPRVLGFWSSKTKDYLNRRMTLRRLLAKCYPEGNPNRRMVAIVRV